MREGKKKPKRQIYELIKGSGKERKRDT